MLSLRSVPSLKLHQLQIYCREVFERLEDTVVPVVRVAVGHEALLAWLDLQNLHLRDVIH